MGDKIFSQRRKARRNPLQSIIVFQQADFWLFIADLHTPLTLILTLSLCMNDQSVMCLLFANELQALTLLFALILLQS
jgi:hypothetical protein